MRLLAFVLIGLASLPLRAQFPIRLERIPIEIPTTTASIEGLAVVETESGSMLVAEMLVEDVRAFYMFVWTGDALVSQVIGPRTIPARFEPPPTHQPESRAFSGEAGRYWGVAGIEYQRNKNERYWVSAPRLSELVYAEVTQGEYPLTPPLESALALNLFVQRPSGKVERACTLEPNLLAVEDRLTTLGASWIRPIDERYLVVPVGTTGTSGVGSVAIWLFDEAYRLQAVTGFDATYDVNRLPEHFQVDLTGDGVDELVIASTAAPGEEPIVVYRIERFTGQSRILHFSSCGPRMQGDDVAALQRALEKAGYSVGPYGIDGWYGPDTRAAVIRYQRAQGLQPTGVFDMDNPLP